MRRLLPIAFFVIAGCATTPQAPQRPAPTPTIEVPRARGDLIGSTAAELLQRFGPPVLQVREGPGVKLQFRGAACVLDAYLYPPADGRGVERVSHVDARLPSGTDTDRAGCIAALQRT